MKRRRTSNLLLVSLTIFTTVTNCLPTLEPKIGTFDERNFNTLTGLPACLESQSLYFVDSKRNDTHSYFEASQGDNVQFHFHPTAIVFPKNAQEVSKTVICAKNNGNIQTVARSGGHAFNGYSSGGQDGAVIIDFANMSSIISDSKNNLAHIEPGARLGDVVKTLWEDNQSGMPHGSCPTVGVGGHSLCGGFGPTSRNWGMSTDHLVEAEIVLANGDVIRVSKDENRDLWWGLRGAGSFFGIVTKFSFKTFKAESKTTYLRYKWQDSIKNLDDAVEIMQAIQAFAKDKDLPSNIGFHVQLKSVSHEGRIAGNHIYLRLRGMYTSDQESYEKKVEPILTRALKKYVKNKDLRNAEGRKVLQLNYLENFALWDDFATTDGKKLDTQTERKIHNNFLTRTSLAMTQKGFSKQGIKTIFQTIWDQAQDDIDQHDENQSHDLTNLDGSKKFWIWNLFFEVFGGVQSKVNDADFIDQSAMQHRDALWLIQSSVGALENAPLAHKAYSMLERMDLAIHKALINDKLPRKSYACYADANLNDWKDLYYGKSIDQMTSLKRKFDPTNLFRNPQSLIETRNENSNENVNNQNSKQEWISGPHPLP